MARLYLAYLIGVLVVASCASQPGGVGGSADNEASQPVTVNKSARYECFTEVGSKHVLTLPVAARNSGIGMVTVTFYGDTLEAIYERSDLTQVWHFEEDLYIILDPDLTAAYMDFRGAEESETRKPDAVFECKKRR